MPQDCMPDNQVSRMKFADYYMLVAYMVAVFGDTEMDCKSVDSSGGRRLDTGAGRQMVELFSKTFAQARKPHCSPASSGHAATSMPLHLLWLTPGRTGTAHRWLRWRRPRH